MRFMKTVLSAFVAIVALYKAGALPQTAGWWPFSPDEELDDFLDDLEHNPHVTITSTGENGQSTYLISWEEDEGYYHGTITATYIETPPSATLHGEYGQVVDIPNWDEDPVFSRTVDCDIASRTATCSYTVTGGQGQYTWSHAATRTRPAPEITARPGSGSGTTPPLTSGTSGSGGASSSGAGTGTATTAAGTGTAGAESSSGACMHSANGVLVGALSALLVAFAINWT